MSALSYSVFVSDYKSINVDPTIWPEPEAATWPASTATLVLGQDEAILIDALILEREGRALAAWIAGHRRRLTTVYVTHGHGDHFFGVAPVIEAFPEARVVALPSVVPEAREQVATATQAFWRGLLPEPIPRDLVIPTQLGATAIDLEGQELRMVEVGQSDTDVSSVVHVPALEAVLGGDVGYNGIHPWLAGTDHDARLAWLAALDVVEGLAPRTIITGHRDPDAPDDDAGRILAETRAYIRDFDELAAIAGDARELVSLMVARHPNLGNPYTLWASAAAQFSA